MHPFAVQAPVVAGERWLTVHGQTQHLRADDPFTLEREVPHAERYGAGGATAGWRGATAAAAGAPFAVGAMVAEEDWRGVRRRGRSWPALVDQHQWHADEAGLLSSVYDSSRIFSAAKASAARMWSRTGCG